MGDLIAVTGWMKPEQKKKLLAAIAKHSFLSGQSDFINKAADALIAQSHNGPVIAQPLCFLTVAERAKVERYDAMQEMITHPPKAIRKEPTKAQKCAKKRSKKKT